MVIGFFLILMSGTDRVRRSWLLLYCQIPRRHWFRSAEGRTPIWPVASGHPSTTEPDHNILSVDLWCGLRLTLLNPKMQYYLSRQMKVSLEAKQSNLFVKLATALTLSTLHISISIYLYRNRIPNYGSPISIFVFDGFSAELSVFFADFYGCLKSGKVSVLIRNCVFLTTKRESRDPIYASSSSCLPSYVWHCRTKYSGRVCGGWGLEWDTPRY